MKVTDAINRYAWWVAWAVWKAAKLELPQTDKELFAMLAQNKANADAKSQLESGASHAYQVINGVLVGIDNDFIYDRVTREQRESIKSSVLDLLPVLSSADRYLPFVQPFVPSAPVPSPLRKGYRYLLVSSYDGLVRRGPGGFWAELEERKYFTIPSTWCAAPQEELASAIVGGKKDFCDCFEATGYVKCSTPCGYVALRASQVKSFYCIDYGMRQYWLSTEDFLLCRLQRDESGEEVEEPEEPDLELPSGAGCALGVVPALAGLALVWLTKGRKKW